MNGGRSTPITRRQHAVGSRAAPRSSPCFFPGAETKTRVYVDGFNLYYGALKGTPFRWLDPVRLTSLLLPRECAIDRLRYFTARVSGKVDPQAPVHQRIYMKALATLPEVEIHYGRFLAKTAWRPRTLPVGADPDRRRRGEDASRTAGIPVPDALIAEFHTMEEKGSDVNLAADLLNDAWKNLFEAEVVISNDTDLVVPIRMVTAERKRPVFVVCPGRWQMAPQLRSAASHVRHIHRAALRAAQFPDTLPGTEISRPAGW